MKKPIHLYIFVVLSGIASILRLFTVMVKTFDEQQVTALYPATEPYAEDIMQVLRETSAFQTNTVNKILGVLLILILIGVIVSLFHKKNEQASLSYAGYVFTALLFNTYQYIGSRQVLSLYSDEMMRQIGESTALVSYLVQVALFAIYMGVTLFFLLRKPKDDKPNHPTTGEI